MQRLSVMIAALWWGGISAISFVAVPMLFAGLGNPLVAGPVAARLFSLQCWGGLFLGAALLWILRGQRAAQADQGLTVPMSGQWALLTILGWVLAAMLLALLQEFGVAHKIVNARATGGNLRLWHSVGTAMVLGQWLCTGVLLWRLSGLHSGRSVRDGKQADGGPAQSGGEAGTASSQCLAVVTTDVQRTLKPLKHWP